MPLKLPPFWTASRIQPPTLPPTYTQHLIGSNFTNTPLEPHILTPTCRTKITEALQATPLGRRDPAHRMHAFRGDSVVHWSLVELGSTRGLGVMDASNLVSLVGSNAALAEMCVSVGLLGIAGEWAEWQWTGRSVGRKTAADIFEAVLGVAEVYVGLERTAGWFVGIAGPWIERVGVGEEVADSMRKKGDDTTRVM